MKKDISTLKIIFKEFKEIKHCKSSYLYFTVFIYALAGGLIPVLSVYIPKIIIGYLMLDNVTSNTLVSVISIIVGITVFLAILTKFCASINTAGFMDVRISQFMFINRKYMKIDYEYLESAKFRDYFNEATTALNGDGMGFQAILQVTSECLGLLVSLITYAVVISFLNIWVFAACLATGVISFIINSRVAKFQASKALELSSLSRKKDYFSRISYDFSYGKDIRLNRLEDKISSDLKTRTLSYLNVLKLITSKKFYLGLIELPFLLLQDGLAYFVVIYSYFNHLIGIDEVALYIGAIISVSEILRSLSLKISDIIKNKKYVIDYYDFMNSNEYYSNIGNRKKIENDTLEIEFKDVSFKYPNTEKYILKNFNFKIEKGQKLAVVGTNGAGKSTIIKLITGLFKVTSGELLINGININEFDKDELYSMFSCVYQDVNIYNATILENVIGDSKKPEDIKFGIECLNMVGLEEKINSLPKRYDTTLLKIVDEDGVELSGGQNQKIAIARALYKNGNMIILDEPTSALDALAEADIYHSFNDLVSSKTAIYISHRLSSTKFCDKIALFDGEGLKEYGTHEELMKLHQCYYKMFETQGKYYQEASNENTI